MNDLFYVFPLNFIFLDYKVVDVGGLNHACFDLNRVGNVFSSLFGFTRLNDRKFFISKGKHLNCITLQVV